MTYDESGRAARCRVVTALLAVVLIVLVGANLCIGSVLVPADHIPGILSGGAANSMESQVIWEIRLPRVLSAVLLGGALSLSGFLLQTFFNNPIADPFILGVSSGAKFVVALTMIVLLGANQAMSSPAMVVAAFLGSLITIGFVLLIARRISSMAILIVAGVMVGYICSAATNFLIAFADDQSIVNLHNWSLGSFSGSSWDDIAVIAIVVLGAWVGLVFVKELIKFKREERRDRKTEARADAKRQKDMEIQELIQDYGDALNQRREREEQQRQLQEVVDRASAHVEPER